MSTNGQTYNYFSDDELKGLDKELCAGLDMARGYSGVPYVLVSTVRTAVDNLACGGAGHSTHCTGHGVDIGLGHLTPGYESDHARLCIIRGLLQAGFRRIGIYPNHIHVDNGQTPDYVQDVAWDTNTEG